MAMGSFLAVACSASAPLTVGPGRDAAGSGDVGAQNEPVPSGDQADAAPPAVPVPDAAPDTAAIVQEAGATTPAEAGTTSPPDAASESAAPVDAPATCEGDACPRRATTISVNGSGPWQACALFNDGTVECWMDGLTMGGPAQAPVPVPGLVGATAVAVGVNKGCAILAGGAVSCWTNTSGVEYNGQPITSATLVPELTGVTALSLGDTHSCAILAGGQAVCWGFNALGELGNGATSNTPTTTPSPVLGLGYATSIAVGAYHTCASNSKGVAYCWGQNDQSQLGFALQGDPYAASPNPTVVPAVSGVASVSAGGSRTCALLGTGEVDCWGFPTKSPTRIDGFGTAQVLSVSTGWYSSCAVLGDGHVACWGDGEEAELGVGTRMSSNTTALVVPSLANVVGVSLSTRVCALAADGTVSCWGPRTYYSTGLSDFDLSPVPVTGL
jgi:alpha-tubulin suppressor-like RCC1 family protein